MTTHKAKILLSNEAYKQINWLTYNYENEIGAVGVGKLRQSEGEKYVYVEKLFFTHQAVSGASVHITNGMWKNLLTNKEFMERQHEMCFYWHKHPGSSPTCSMTDEEDTFDTFMSKEAGRKWFAFLQTAKKSYGDGMELEARIDIRKPIRVTIENKDIDVTYELPPEDEKFKKNMEKLIESVVTKDEEEEEEKKGLEKTINQTDDLKGLAKIFTLEKSEKKVYMDNDLLDGESTAVDEKVSITAENGHILVKAGKNFQNVMTAALTKKKGRLFPLVHRYKVKEEGTKKCYDLQPVKKCYENLSQATLEMFIKYNKFLLEERAKAEEKEDKNATEEDDFSFEIWKNEDKATLKGLLAIQSILAELETLSIVEWKSDTHGIIFSFMRDKQGTFKLNKDLSIAVFEGKDLIKFLKEFTCLGEADKPADEEE
jgi:hypothetical protein